MSGKCVLSSYEYIVNLAVVWFLGSPAVLLLGGCQPFASTPGCLWICLPVVILKNKSSQVENIFVIIKICSSYKMI